MKKLLLLLPFLLSFSAWSQSRAYHPFPVTWASWNYQYYDDSHFPTGYFNAYFLNGDTSFNSIQYKKIYLGTLYQGALRESSRIIYFIPDTSVNEYTLYDFNLQVGDSVIHPYGGALCSNDTVIVEQIDSILCSDGMHARFYFSSFAQWIEGAGSIFHLLQPLNLACVSGEYLLECFEGDAFEYHNLSTSYCILSTNNLQGTKNFLSVFPNPFHSTAAVQLPEGFTQGELKMYNMLGEEVHEQLISNRYSVISGEGLTPGIYFFRISSPEGEWMGKVMVE